MDNKDFEIRIWGENGQFNIDCGNLNTKMTIAYLVYGIKSILVNSEKKYSNEDLEHFTEIILNKLKE